MIDAPPLKSSRVIQATPFFYGWVILAVGTIGSVMIGPSQTFTVGIFTESFIAELGLSRSSISLIYGCATFSGSMLLPLTGRLVDRYGPKWVSLIIVIGLGLACIGMGLANGVVTLLLGFLALRFMGFGSLQLVSNNIIAQWFIRKRGLVMGLAGQSLAVSLILYPVLTRYLIGEIGWRWTWVTLGLLIWLVMLPLTLLFFKDRPEQYGLFPDGDQPPDQTHTPDMSPLIAEENWTLPQARQTGAFWLFATALSSMTLILSGLVFHQLSLFEQRNLPPDTAITAFQVMAFFSIIANIGMGRLLDTVSARLLLAVVLILLMSAMGLVQIMNTPVQAFVYAALLGLISGSFRVLDATVWAKYFGRQYLGSIRGATMIGVVGATAFGPYLLGFSLDYLGSYSPVLNGLLIIPLTICLLARFVRRPVYPVVKKQ
ncbi:MFS transporter [Anaerolineales bacterium HSG6]|nr:MFS transporter [Anaerolineales bacterium HSG6]MDM8530675.1 MFS transporter [Anaerolineales bacterium HSG25]